MATPTETKFESPFIVSSEKIAELGVPEHEIENYRRYYYQQQFGVQKWYDRLKDFTFASQFLLLNESEINAILCSKLRPDIYAKNPEDRLKYENDEDVQEHKCILKTLEGKLDGILKNNFAHGAFMKLNTRSPKDVPCEDIENKQHVEKMKDSIDEEIPKLLKREQKTIVDDNILMAAFYGASIQQMKVNKGSDVVDLLLCSQRVYQDLQRVKSYQKYSNEATASITIREWNDAVIDNLDMEYRGFVHNNSLNALSQYDDVTAYVRVQEKENMIAKKILDFFNENVRDVLVDIESYVVDFLYDLENDQVYIVELNPFHVGAGPCLFSWQTDRELFFNGPFEFRIVKKDTNTEMENALDYLLPFWERILIEKKKNYPQEKQGCIVQ